MADLYYVVIAPKSNEVDQVVAKLEDQNQDGIAQWLAEKKDSLYGRRNEDWKPFDDRTIRQLVNETKGYQTATDLIDALDSQVSDISSVVESPVRIYFIDVFALFLDKYVKLATKLDALVAGHGECCLVMSHELPSDIQEHLIGTYCRSWGTVCNEYRRGRLHRIAMRLDDLRNFRNHLLLLSQAEDRPSPIADRDLNTRWGNGDKPLPVLA